MENYSNETLEIYIETIISFWVVFHRSFTYFALKKMYFYSKMD